MDEFFTWLFGFMVGAVVMVYVLGPLHRATLIEAVERGHAEWVTDANGCTCWQWKESDK